MSLTGVDSDVQSKFVDIADFYGDFELVEQRVVGEKHLKCNLKLQGTNSVLEGIAFFQEKLQSKKVRAAYKLSVNSFRGNESLQLMIESIENIN